MATPRRLNFSSPGGVGGDGDDDSDENCPPLTRRTSLRKATSKRPVEEDPNKKKKSASSSLVQIWNEDDELAILKGFVEYRCKNQVEPNTTWDAFFHFIKGSIHVKVSKKQLSSKISKLKKKFRVNTERISQGMDPLFPRSTDYEAFEVSKLLWGNNAVHIQNLEENGNDEHVNENGAADTNANGNNESVDIVVVDLTEDKTDGKEPHDNETERSNFDGNSLQALVDKITQNRAFGKKSHDKEAGTSNTNGESFQELGVDKRTENKTDGKERHDNEAGTSKADGDGEPLEELGVDKGTENKAAAGEESHDDELCALHDAFETMLSQGLSDYQKNLHLKKLMDLENEKRKELSNEWYALCAEESKFNIKKLRFSAKLVEAAIDG